MALWESGWSAEKWQPWAPGEAALGFPPPLASFWFIRSYGDKIEPRQTFSSQRPEGPLTFSEP